MVDVDVDVIEVPFFASPVYEITMRVPAVSIPLC